MATTDFPYVVVDVFTREPFGGNPLAVITDARGLTDVQMQRIANEFNFSETTFVLPPVSSEHTARVRIFNRTQEMPFAGHPNVGTAFVLGQMPEVFGRAPGRSMTFEELAGLVPVELQGDGGSVSGAVITAPRSLDVGQVIDPAAIAACLQLPAGDLVLARHPPIQVSVGLQFVVVEVALASLPKASPGIDAFRAVALQAGGVDNSNRFSVFAYARAGEGIGQLRARMFAPLSGTWEDPATGSASAALAAYLVTLAAEPEGHFEILIDQGVEMGRPSRLQLNARKSAGRVTDVRIAGRCVQTMRGLLTL